MATIIDLKKKVKTFFSDIYDDEDAINASVKKMMAILSPHIPKQSSKKASKKAADDSDDDGEGLRSANGKSVKGYKAVSAFLKASPDTEIVLTPNFKDGGKSKDKVESYDTITDWIKAKEPVRIGDVTDFLKGQKEPAISINAIIWGLLSDKDRVTHLG